jgi:hypothetical protein
MGKGTLVASFDAAKLAAAERAWPLSVVAIDDGGNEELSERLGENGQQNPCEDAPIFASTLVRNIRAHDGHGRFGNAALRLNLTLKITHVRIYANDGAKLWEQTV